MEEHYGAKHDNTALEDRFEEPDQERFNRKRASFLKCGVKWWVLHHHVNTDIVIEHEREDWQTSVDRCVTKDQHTVVDRNGDIVEDTGEDGLDDRDDQASMNDELGEYGRAFVAKTSMPQDQAAELLELIDREIRCK